MNNETVSHFNIDILMLSARVFNNLQKRSNLYNTKGVNR